MTDPRMDGVLLVIKNMQNHIKELNEKVEALQQFSKQHRSDLVKLQQKVNELERKTKEKPAVISRF